jgi:hypothetical protein
MSVAVTARNRTSGHAKLDATAEIFGNLTDDESFEIGVRRGAVSITWLGWSITRSSLSIAA